MQQIYFVSTNVKKYEELKKLLPDVDLIWHQMEQEELQTENAEILIKNKAQKAFKELRRPLIVDHTELRIHAFKDLPGLGTRSFYDRIGAREIIEYCKIKKDFVAEVRTYLCFCDGMKFYISHGDEAGEITTNYKENENAFAWDSIFIPSENNPQKLIYEEIDGSYKHSMRKKAVSNLKEMCLSTWATHSTPEDEENDISDLLKKLVTDIEKTA